MRVLVAPLLLCCLAWTDPALARRIVVDRIDATALAVASLARQGPGIALEVARGAPQKDLGLGRGLVDPGHWTPAPDGRLRWKLEVEAPGALGIELLLEELELPEGSRLWLEDRLGRAIDVDLRGLRPGGGRLTPLIDGQTLTLWLDIRASDRGSTRLRLSSVLSSFLDPDTLAAAKAGACNVDLACPEAADWRDLARGVAHLRIGNPTSGSSCSGQLIANTAGTPRPLLLTANHCLRTAAQAQATTLYWNYRAAQCRAPGTPASGQPLPLSLASHVQSGAGLLATWAPSDFTLVELDAPVPDGVQAWWSGWDRRDQAPQGPVVTLHHPEGHEQRFSLSTSPTALSAYLGPPGSGTSHLRVANWTLGTTEPGSSGAGLWNAAGQLVGQLHGGFAACGNSEPDWYGRLAQSWEGGGTPQTRLRDHLDPLGSGVETQPGYRACDAPLLQLEAPAPRAGETLALALLASGGQPPYRYDWDLDADGQFELSGPGLDRIETRFPAPGPARIRARVTDASGCPAVLERELVVAGPRLSVVAVEPPVAECGGPELRSGGIYRLAVELRNDGDAGTALAALFAPARYGSGAATADRHGHVLLDDEAGCGFDYIDISDGPPLALSPSSGLPAEDDGRTAPIALARPLDFYGFGVTTLVMSTNGYLSTSASATGGDFANACPASPQRPARDGEGGRLAVLHDDLVVNPGGGLYHRWFADCPRPAEAGPGGCHVFQWTGMGRFTPLGPNAADFQALVYPDTGQIVYQYRTAAVADGAEATVGVQSPAHDDRALYSCNQANRVRAGRAVCMLPPAARLADGRRAPLRLLDPVHELGTLAAGQRQRIELRFQIEPDAACPAPIGIDFLGAIEGAALPGQRSSGHPRRDPVLRSRLQACVPTACSAPTPPWPAEGNAFDPGRPGNGIEQHVIRAPTLARPVYYGAWFTGDGQHLPLWYIVQGDYAHGQVQAPVLRFRADTPAQGMRVGDAQIGWLDPQRAVLRWRIGEREGIEALRHAFAGIPAAERDRTGGWFNPGEAGWGLTVNSYRLGGAQRELLIAYLYDASGAPRWLLADAGLDPVSTPARLRRAHCPGCPWLARDPAEDAIAGQLGWRFTSPSEGLFSSQIALPAPLSGQWNRSDLPLVLLTPPERP